MRNVKIIRRAKVLCIVFLSTLFVGSAFAFAAGTLDIRGGIYISTPGSGSSLAFLGSGSLVWSYVSPPSGFGFVESTLPDIVPANGVSSQRIYWNVMFNEAGTAAITAAATNESPMHTVRISNVSYIWEDTAFGFSPFEFGFNVHIDYTSFTGAVLSYGETRYVVVSVQWSGAYDEHFDFDPEVLFSFLGTLVIEFDYEIV